MEFHITILLFSVGLLLNPNLEQLRYGECCRLSQMGLRLTILVHFITKRTFGAIKITFSDITNILFNDRFTVRVNCHHHHHLF